MRCTLNYRARLIADAYRGRVPTGVRVLDVGCGNGVVSEKLMQLLNIRLVGTDIMDYRKVRVPFEIMPSEGELPFADGSFDYAMVNDVLHHCQNPEDVIREAMRVARRVMIFEMYPTFAARLADRLVNMIHNPLMNQAINLKTRTEWSALCALTCGADVRSWDLRKPGWWYPFKNFVIKLQRKDEAR